jgi:hypothetical protein
MTDLNNSPWYQNHFVTNTNTQIHNSISMIYGTTKLPIRKCQMCCFLTNTHAQLKKKRAGMRNNESNYNGLNNIRYDKKATFVFYFNPMSTITIFSKFPLHLDRYLGKANFAKKSANHLFDPLSTLNKFFSN